MGPDSICMDTFNSHMWQTISIKIIMDVSLASHISLTITIYGVGIKQNVDQASHMWPILSHSLIV
jgi:hypothetical protein